MRDHFNREIRYGRISRSMARDALSIYEKKEYKFDAFFDWLNISESGKIWLYDRVFDRAQGAESTIGRAAVVQLTPAIEQLLPSEQKDPSSLFVVFDKQLEI